MEKISITQIQELRQRTGAGVTDCKRTLESTGGNMDAAVEELRKRGITKAAEREARKTTEGIIANYVHHNGRLAALVELNCETDFVARTEDFRTLAKQLAEHIAAAAPLTVDLEELPQDVVARRRAEIEEELRVSNKPEHLREQILDGKLDAFYRGVVLVKQPWVREPKRTIGELINETSARVGEHVKVRRFARFEMETVRVTPEGGP
jgi:elongation factor Ts